jgi:hypothetical protein
MILCYMANLFPEGASVLANLFFGRNFLCAIDMLIIHKGTFIMIY